MGDGEWPLGRVNLPVDKGTVTADGTTGKGQLGVGMHQMTIHVCLGGALEVTVLERALQTDYLHACLPLTGTVANTDTHLAHWRR